jgi:hypothetical protein
MIKGAYLMSNVQIFRDFLQQQNVFMEEVQEENGGVFFRTRQDLKMVVPL